MKREELEELEREALLDEASRVGVARPEVLTREELIDAIETLEERAAGQREGSKGLLSRMRHVLATFVEKGLNLPQAAERIRAASGSVPPEPMPLATVTLAEIYAAQGHNERAMSVLDQILAREPDHPTALRLRARLLGQPAPVGLADEDEEEETPQPPALTLDPALIGETPYPNRVAAVAVSEVPVADDDDDGDEGEAVVAAPLDATPLDATPAVVAPVTLTAAAAPAAAPPAGPPRPAPMLDEEPLPERYDVDELVLMPVDPTTLYFYWEIRPETLLQARHVMAWDDLIVRIEQLLPGNERRVLREMPISSLGDHQAEHLPAGVRCIGTIGVRSGARWHTLIESAPRQLAPASAVAEPARNVVLWTTAQSLPLWPPPPAVAVSVAIQEALAPGNPWPDFDREAPYSDASALEGERSAPSAAHGASHDEREYSPDSIFFAPAEPLRGGAAGVGGAYEGERESLGSSGGWRGVPRPLGSSGRMHAARN